MTISASVGVAVYPGSAQSQVSPDILLERADEAMYLSKRGGKDRTTIVIVDGDPTG
jgi:GGDEF domain-containing protein